MYRSKDRIFRSVSEHGLEAYRYVQSTGLLQDLCAEGRVIEAKEVPKSAFRDPAAAILLEHPRLPFISYPYEWPFSLLKAAALAHLDIQIRALERDVALSDASAYNMQFKGVEPVFIDYLSFRRYEDGEFWSGHRQFCEQFLNPLLLHAKLGVAHNAWFRGGLEGIPAVDLARILPWRSKFHPKIFAHVVLQARFQRMSLGDARSERETAAAAKLPRHAFEGMLTGLRSWIEALSPRDGGASHWADYADNNSYDDEERQRKQAFVAAFCAGVKPTTLFDIGCNTGVYAQTALASGATRVIGFDADLGALEGAVARSKQEGLDFLPVYLDAANPSPSQGWFQAEREGYLQRGHADAVLALALVHHLVIGRNIPLAEWLDWLLGLAPKGVVEFVPKSDPMVSRLLSFRDDIFHDYEEAEFERLLSQNACIIKTEVVSKSGRTLYWYEIL